MQLLLLTRPCYKTHITHKIIELKYKLDNIKKFILIGKAISIVSYNILLLVHTNLSFTLVSLAIKWKERCTCHFECD